MSNSNVPKSLTIWDECLVDHFAETHKNYESTWNSRNDTESKYKANIANKKNASQITYQPSDFGYEYNSYGYRCDEFDKKK